MDYPYSERNEKTVQKVKFEDFSKICRTCLQCITSEEEQLISDILDTTNVSITILLKAYVTPEITSEYNKPQNLCVSCLEELQGFHTFLEMSKKNDQILNKAIDHYNRKNVQEDAGHFIDCDDNEVAFENSDSEDIINEGSFQDEICCFDDDLEEDGESLVSDHDYLLKNQENRYNSLKVFKFDDNGDEINENNIEVISSYESQDKDRIHNYQVDETQNEIDNNIDEILDYEVDEIQNKADDDDQEILDYEVDETQNEVDYNDQEILDNEVDVSNCEAYKNLHDVANMVEIIYEVDEIQNEVDINDELHDNNCEAYGNINEVEIDERQYEVDDNIDINVYEVVEIPDNDKNEIHDNRNEIEDNEAYGNLQEDDVSDDFNDGNTSEVNKNEDENKDDVIKYEMDVENEYYKPFFNGIGSDDDDDKSISDIDDNSSDEALIQELLELVEKLTYKCEECDLEFKEEKLLIKHKKETEHLSNHKKIKCAVCSKMIGQNIMDIHMERHNKGLECDLCPKKFTLRANLKRHRKLHSLDKKFLCILCDRRFSSEESLKKHHKVHEVASLSESYKCEYCSRVFVRYEFYKRHVRKHAVNSDREEEETEKKRRRFACDICSKTYTSCGSLKTHQATHGDRNFLCTFCGLAFYHKCNLIDHRRIHTGEKPFKCEICDKCFTQKSTLDTHTLQHTGIRPHQCNVCGKSFAQLAHLKHHLLSHTGEKPYGCDHCDRRFTTRATSQAHALTHIGIKPFQCEICGKFFYNANSRNKHKKKFHE